MYVEENFPGDILKRMKDDVNLDVDKLEGSFIHDILSPVSKESANRYKKLEDVLSKAIPQFSKGKFLEMHAANRGVFRKKGEYSSTIEKITGTKGSFVPAGTMLQTLGGLAYLTVEDIAIGDNGVSYVPIKAKEVGTKFNVPKNTITQLSIQINGVISVTNENLAEGGADPESDEELLKRFLESVKNTSSSGNKDDYIKWAKEVEGVKGVKVLPLWNGPGTVKMIIYGDNGKPLDSIIINKVKNYIDPRGGTGDGKAPIGASVTVSTPILRAVNITIVNLQTDDINIAIKNIRENVESYLENIEPGTNVRIKDIEAIITKTEFIKDYSYILLNGDKNNVVMDDESKPVIGTIDYKEDESLNPEAPINKIIVIQSFASLDNVILKHGIYSPKDGGIKC